MLKEKKFRKKKLNKEELKISEELCCFELNTRQLLMQKYTYVCIEKNVKENFVLIYFKSTNIN